MIVDYACVQNAEAKKLHFWLDYAKEKFLQFYKKMWNNFK